MIHVFRWQYWQNKCNIYQKNPFYISVLIKTDLLLWERKYQDMSPFFKKWIKMRNMKSHQT